MKRLLAAVLLLGACAAPMREGAQRPPAETSAEDQQVARAYDDLRRLEADLHDADAQAAEPDCAQVGQLRDNICALAARICQIAERQPASSVAADRCSDGRMRCKSAVERTQARGCPKK